MILLDQHILKKLHSLGIFICGNNGKWMEKLVTKMFILRVNKQGPPPDSDIEQADAKKKKK